MYFKRIGIFFCSLLLIGVMSGCMSNSNEKEMLNYLEEKYNENFIVENFKSGNRLVNQYGGDEAILHLEGNDNLVFTAGTSDKKDGGYYDNYYLSKFANDLNDNIEYIIKENIGTSCDYRVVLYSTGKYDSEEVMDMTAEEYINYDKENIRFALELGIEVGGNEEVSKYYEGIYKVFEEIKSYGTRRYSMSIGFVDNINDSEVQEYLRKVNAIGATWEDIHTKIYGQMFPTYVDSINSAKDLEKLYIKLGE